MPRAAAGEAPPEKNFRFFDNRQKYLLFVNTCSEKDVVASRVGLELGHIHPRPPAVRLFDAGMGDGTVLARVMREMHRRFPTVPFYIVGKEISLEDVRLSLRKMADRFYEHPATVLVVTNMYYTEAPWLTPRTVPAPPRWSGTKPRSPALPRTTFAEQITALEPFLAKNWQARHSPKTGNPVYEHPVALVIYRDDYRFMLDEVIPRARQGKADYDMVIASQPYRLRAPLEFKAEKVVAPLVRALGKGGRLLGIHSHGQDPGLEIIRKWPGENPYTQTRHDILRATKASSARRRGATTSTPTPTRARYLPLRDAHAAERDLDEHRHLDAVRGVERRHLCRADGRRAPLGSAARHPLPGRHPRGIAKTWQPLVSRRVVCRFPQARLSRAAGRASELLIGARSRFAARAPPRGRRGALRRRIRASTSRRCPACRSRARSRRSPPCAPPAWIRCRTSARSILNEAEFRAFLKEAVAKHGVHRVLLVGGDEPSPRDLRRQPADPRSGLLADSGIREIGVAGYPEGHPAFQPVLRFCLRKETR